MKSVDEDHAEQNGESQIPSTSSNLRPANQPLQRPETVEVNNPNIPIPTAAPRVRRYFSTRGKFSKCPRVNINALTCSLIKTLPEGNAAQPYLSRQLEATDLSSGGRVASQHTQAYRHPNHTQRKVSFNPFVAKR